MNDEVEKNINNFKFS